VGKPLRDKDIVHFPVYEPDPGHGVTRASFVIQHDEDVLHFDLHSRDFDLDEIIFDLRFRIPDFDPEE